jgi:rhodanese-related sulfurtransferase
MKITNASVEASIGKVFPWENGNGNALLLDLRTPAEFEEAHIEGSILHPLSNLDAGEVAGLPAGALLGYFVHPAWMALSGLVGAGLVFAGLTDTCGMGMLLARMPWNNRASG